MKLLWSTFIVETFCFWTCTSMTARPSGIAQLLLTLGILVLLVLWPLVLVFTFLPKNLPEWKKYFAVLSAAPIGLMLSLWTGIKLRDYLFQRDLPQMKRFVSLVQSGSIPIIDKRVIVPSEFKSLASYCRVNKEIDKSLTVTFMVGGGFPVKHFGYMYRSNGTPTLRQYQDWAIRQRNKQWFEISD